MFLKTPEAIEMISAHNGANAGPSPVQGEGCSWPCAWDRHHGEPAVSFVPWARRWQER